MPKIQINDLDDLNVEQFATLTDLEAAGIQGGKLSTTLGLIGGGLVLGSRVSAAVGGPIGLGVGAGLFLGGLAFGGLAGVAAAYDAK
jgi:hypothetical protein